MYEKTYFKLKKKHSECGLTANDASEIDEAISAQDILMSYCVGDQRVDRHLPVDRDKLFGWSGYIFFCLYQNLFTSLLEPILLLLTAFFWTNTPLRRGLLLNEYKYSGYRNPLTDEQTITLLSSRGRNPQMGCSS